MTDRLNQRFLRAILVVAIGSLVAWVVLKYADSEARLPAVSDDDKAKQSAQMFGTAPVAQPAPVGLDMKHPVRLAIGSLGFADEEQNRRVSDLALAQLAGAKGLDMVERQSLDAVLQELRLSAAGLVRAKDAVRVGKLLRADWFLLGSPTSLNGTNYTVVRIVDARTGILREAEVFESGPASSRLASELAGFVRKCRQNAAEAKSRVYLAVGSFEDLSVNNRQATLPTQLRSYLTAAYQRADVTLLEREFASTLLQEVRLDLAGLTEEAVTNASVMQSAYWMVNGFYQSYETTNLQVELVLNVRRMFGKSQQIALREKPGEPLFRGVKSAIDRLMAQNQAGLVFSRLTETKALMGTGKELARIKGDDMLDYVWANYEGLNPVPENEMTRRIRNAEEAVRAFETVLLLDPTNREARICLATCFRKTLIQRLDEARDYYREIIDISVEDRWSNVARQALVSSFEWPNPGASPQWFENAAQRTVNPAAVEFYQAQAKRAAEDAIIWRRGTPEAEKVAEERLFRDIQVWESEMRGHMFSVDFDHMGLGKYAEAFGTNHALAARTMVALLPKLQAASTNLAPHIFAGVVTFQVDTNASIIGEFERSLDALSETPTQYFEHRYYIDLLASPVYRWAEERQLYRLAAKIKEIHAQMANRDREMNVNDEDRMGLAFNYLRAEVWQKALEIFQSYSNRPVQMGNSGLWGRAFTVVLTSKQVALCRKKLGLPPVIDSREFDLGEPCLHLHGPNKSARENSVFATTSDGLWIGVSDQVMHLDFDLKTNFVAQLSLDSSASLSTLCVGESNLWIGTAGGGLLELNKATHAIQCFTEKDGLLMNYISGLHLAGDVLWIGYGNESGGGLGRLDLSTHRFTSFSASLSSGSAATKPPRQMVTAIQGGSTSDIWFIAKSTLSKYRPAENAWEEQPYRNGVWASCYALDNDHLIKGLEIATVELTIETKPSVGGATNLSQKIKRIVSFEESERMHAILKTNRGGQWVSGSSVGSSPNRGGLESRNFRDGRQQRLLEVEGLPNPPTTLALQGRELWVGGQGFVALVDLDENRIKKLAYVPTRSVDQIQLGGGFVWVKYDGYLHRASLRDVQ